MSYTMASTFNLVPGFLTQDACDEAVWGRKKKRTIEDVPGLLGTLILRKKKAIRDQKEQESVATLIKDNLLSHLEGVLHLAAANKKAADEDEEQSSSLLGRLLKQAGLVIFRATVRPILRFAMNAIRSIARFAVRAVVRYLVVPVFTAITGFIVANPITAAIGATLLLGAGGYALYRKLTGSKEGVQDVNVSSVPPPAAPTTVGVTSPVAQVQTFFTPSTVEFTPYRPTAGGKQDKNFKGFGSEMDSYIRETSSRYGLDEAMLRGLVKMEGGWTGAASQTGALGPGQFTGSTWNNLINKFGGASLGMKPVTRENRGTANDPRRDNRINMLATGLLASINAKELASNGLPVNGTNLYMMHNIGSGIIPVMKGRQASAKTIQDMRYNGMRQGQSAAEFLEMQKAKFEYHKETANVGPTGTKLQAASSVTPSTGFSVNKDIATASALQQDVQGSNAVGASSGNSQVKDVIKTKNTLIGVK